MGKIIALITSIIITILSIIGLTFSCVKLVQINNEISKYQIQIDTDTNIIENDINILSSLTDKDAIQKILDEVNDLRQDITSNQVVIVGYQNKEIPQSVKLIFSLIFIIVGLGVFVYFISNYD